MSIPRNPVRFKKVREVKLPKTRTVTLVPVLVRRGEHESLLHVPECAVCHKPIVDFDSGNLVTVGLGDAKPVESLGRIGDAEILRLHGAAIAVCFGCDQRGWKPWNRLSSVFSRDQRHPAERLGFSVAA